METTTISASIIKVGPWKGKKKLDPAVGLEFGVSRLYGVCFDESKKLDIESQSSVVADLISTVIPKKLRLVVNPFGGKAGDYSGQGLKKVLIEDEDVATYIADEFYPEDELNDTVRKQVEDLAVTDPCCMSDDADHNKEGRNITGSNQPGGNQPEEKLGGGRVCSRPLYKSNSSAPLTFHLKMDDIWGKFGSPTPGILDDGRLDHFLLPSKLPGNSVVWLAFPRDPDPRENYRKLKEWEKGTYKFAGFDGLIFTSDALKISIAFDARPKSS